jgi:hypothetical protein
MSRNISTVERCVEGFNKSDIDQVGESGRLSADP